MESIKAKIKELSVQQRELKNQRRTVRLIGARTIEPWRAAYQHAYKRYELRKLNIAYGLLKGRKIEEIEPTTKNPIYVPGHYAKDEIDKLVASIKELVS